MFVIVLLSLLLFCGHGFSADSSGKSVDTSTGVTCDKNTLRRIDELAARLTTYGNSGRKFPESLDDMPKYCNDTKQILDQVEKLNKNCVKGLAKNILAVGMYTIAKRLKKSCGKKSQDVTELNFAAGRCVNKAQNIVNKCFTRGIDNLLGIQLVDEKKRIPMACCEVPKLKECIRRIVDKVDICKDEHTDLTLRFLDSIIGNSLNFACAEYTAETDRCNGLKPPKKLKTQRRSKSMIVAFLHLFQSIPENKNSNENANKKDTDDDS